MTKISTSYRRCNLTLPTNLCNTSYSAKDTSLEISSCGSNTRSSEAASGGNSKHAASHTRTSILMHFTSPCKYSILHLYYLIVRQSSRNNGSKVAPSRTTSWILFTSQTRHTAVARGLASSRQSVVYHIHPSIGCTEVARGLASSRQSV